MNKPYFNEKQFFIFTLFFILITSTHSSAQDSSDASFQIEYARQRVEDHPYSTPHKGGNLENHLHTTPFSPPCEGGPSKIFDLTTPLFPPCEGGDGGVVMKPKEIPPDTMQTQDVEFIKVEVIKILSGFIVSEAYKELQGAQILGREIPILLRWDRQIMRGTIDILYKIDNRLIIADYKTDHVKANELPAKTAKYNYQKEVYIEAVKRCLNIDNLEFKLIFLRLGKATSI